MICSNRDPSCPKCKSKATRENAVVVALVQDSSLVLSHLIDAQFSRSDRRSLPASPPIILDAPMAFLKTRELLKQQTFLSSTRLVSLTINSIYKVIGSTLRSIYHETQTASTPRHVSTPPQKSQLSQTRNPIVDQECYPHDLDVNHSQFSTMEPSAVIPNYDQTFPLKDEFRAFRRPSTLTVSSIASSRGRSPEPSPTRERFRRGSEITDVIEEEVVQGPFMYVGHQKRRFHPQRDLAPYPLPCGLEELSRYSPLQQL
jgi:hypothetical protein